MMKKTLMKVFDCTLGALWRLYVRMIVNGIFVIDNDLDFADWALAIIATALFVCAIPIAFGLLLLLVMTIIGFPLQTLCIIIGITTICILPLLALKSYRSSKAKALAAASAASAPSKATKKTRKPTKGFNQ